jgi:branched-chain amino acid transport system permease protein
MAVSSMALATAVVDGLALGGLYALVAISFNVLYRPTNVFNFAQGELVMLGAMLGAITMGATGLGFWPAALVVLAAVGMLCLLQGRLTVEPVLRRSSSSHSWLITTLAFSMIVVNAVNLIWSPDPIRVAPPWPFSTRAVSWDGVLRTSTYKLAVIAAAVGLTLVIEWTYRSRLGLAVQAVAEDREAALLRGIRPDQLGRLSFFAGGALAGLAGLMAAPIMFASTGLGAILLFKGFAAAAIGGIGSNKGALLAGLTIGVAESLGVLFLSPGYQLAVVFLLFLVVLMIRPQGFFGRIEERHV